MIPNEQEKRQKALQDRLDAALRGITDELKKRGLRYEAQRDGLGHRRAISQVEDEYLSVEVRTERSRSWMPDKIRIRVGSYGNISQFPERKAGFDFVKVVDQVEARLKGMRETRVFYKDREQKHEELRDAEARVHEQVGGVPGVSLSVDEHLDGLNVRIGSLPEDKALAVMRALKEIL
jgi:hypothetical protein